MLQIENFALFPIAFYSLENKNEGGEWGRDKIAKESS